MNNAKNIIEVDYIDKEMGRANNQVTNSDGTDISEWLINFNLLIAKFLIKLQIVTY